MKHNGSFILGILTVTLTFGVFWVGCDNETGSGDDPIVISGILSSSGSLPSRSIAASRSAVATSQTFRAEIGSDNSISGKLKDGSITFNLTGQYDPATKVFSMQAPSSLMIFSIAGKLNARNAIDTGMTSASVKVKNGNEWTSIPLTLTVNNSQTVDEAVNADTSGVTSIPAYCRGRMEDQIMAAMDRSLKYVITKNSITMFDGSKPPQDLTVVEVTNFGGGIADENGPWTFIVRGTYSSETLETSSVEYTGKFYVSKIWDNKIDTEIGSQTVSDVAWGDTFSGSEVPLSTAKEQFSGIRAWVIPYASSSNVSTDGIIPTGDYSPLFIGDSATVNAKAAETLKAFSGFTLALK